MKRLVFGLLTALVPILVTALAFEVLTRLVVDDGMQFDLEMWKYARDVKYVSADPLIAHVLKHCANEAPVHCIEMRSHNITGTIYQRTN